MIATSLFHIRSGTPGFAPRITAAVVRLRIRWAGALGRVGDKLRPIEWILLFVGAVALFMFVYVLWRQPVSRR